MVLPVAALILINCVVVEVAVRAYFAWEIGPRVFFYGTPWHRQAVEVNRDEDRERPVTRSVQFHEQRVDVLEEGTLAMSSYTKYYPNEKKQTQSHDRTAMYDVQINEHGFRGDSFDIQKPAGTVRILTLGASSTFGYHNREDETYPFLLERALEAASGERGRFEVINFAIPHATTDQIIAMLWNEGFRLDPDVITFYEGANDAAVIEPRDGDSGWSFRQMIVDRSLFLALVDRFAPFSRETDLEWCWNDGLAAQRERVFLRNLDWIREECERRGIVFVVATQQFRSTLLASEGLEGVTYAQEVEFVRGKVRDGVLGPGSKQKEASDAAFGLRVNSDDPWAIAVLNGYDFPRAMLVHARLMEGLRAWATTYDVPLVDVVEKLDSQRHLLVNWVHLRPEANAVVARALAEEILEQLQSGDRSRDRLAGP